MRTVWIGLIGVLLLLSCISVSPKKEISDVANVIPSVIAGLPRLIPAPDPCKIYVDGSGGKDACYYNLSIAERNPSLCEKISGLSEKDNCYYFQAKASKNSAHCERIKSLELREYCLRDSVIDPGSAAGCGSVEPSKRTSCYLNEALSRNGTGPCSYIPLGDDKLKCYASVAGKTLDIALCQKAGDELGDYCIFDIANRTRKVDYCYFLNGSIRDECLFTMAKYAHNKTLCAKMGDRGAEDECNYFFTATYDLPVACFNFKEPSVRDTCYSDYARINRTVTVCENVTSANLLGKENCIRDVAIALGNSTYCLPLNISSVRDGCYSAILMLTRTSP
ncbi:MAG TPA: hypothetical protein VJI13_06315 [Candidatus Norongarragalinales archaeon]|nr:hypothetical protein [Candidatus Norongarragalinales archaeon]